MTFIFSCFIVKQKSKNNQQKRMLKQKWTAASSRPQPFSVLCLRNRQAPWSLSVWKPKSGLRRNAAGSEISDRKKGSELTKRKFRECKLRMHTWVEFESW